MRRHFRSSTLLFTLLLSVTLTCVAERLPQRIVAYAKQPVPGINGAEFLTLFPAAISNAGDVTFSAQMFVDGMGAVSGIWVERNGLLLPFVLDGDPSPFLALPAGDPIEFLSPGQLPPNLNDAGSAGQGYVGFISRITGGDQVLVVQAMDDPFFTGGLAGVAQQDTPAPGAPGFSFFRFLMSAEELVLNSNGTAAFDAEVVGSSINDRRGGNWIYEGGQLQPIVVAGQPAPGVADATFILSGSLRPGPPKINSRDEAFFFSILETPGESNRFSLWRWRDGSLSSLVVENDDIRPLSGISLNDAGQVAYKVRLDRDYAISVRPGNAAQVLSDRDNIGSITTGGKDYLLLSNGALAVIGGVAPAQGEQSVHGIYLAQGGLAPIELENRPAPGLPAGVVFDRFQDLTANASGQLAFRARLVGGDTDVNSDNALYCTDLLGNSKLVAREGDTITLNAAGNPADSTVARLTTFPIAILGGLESNNTAGRRRFLNDSGQLVWYSNVRFDSPADIAGQNGQIVMVSDCGAPQSNTLSLPRGLLAGNLDANRTILTQTEEDIEIATVTLIRQRDFIRDQNPGETDEDYQEYIDGQLTAQTRVTTLDVVDGGKFLFTDLPLIDPVSSGSTRINRPVFYTARVRSARSEEIDTDAMDGSTKTVYFSGDDQYNLRARLSDPDEAQFVLTPLDAIANKERLVVELTQLGPENYQVVEAQVQAFLDSIKANPSPQQIEAVRRAILVERMAKSGVRFADQLVGTALDGLTKLIGDLIDDRLPKGNADLANRRKRVEALEDQVDFLDLGSRGWLEFDSANATDVQNQLNELIQNNPDLELSLYADLAKAGGNALYSVVNSALVSARLEKSTAAQAAKAVKLTFDTVIAAAVTRGLAGAAKPAIKALIGEIIKSNKGALIDSPAFYSYTALTEDSLIASRLLMESWNTDNQEAFEADRADFIAVDNDMGYDVLVVANGITAFSTEISDAFSGVGAEIIGLLGPKGRAVKKAMNVIKYASNATTIGVPFLTAYGKIAGPDIDVPIFIGGFIVTYELGLLDRGVKEAYNTFSLPAKAAPGMAGGQAEQPRPSTAAQAAFLRAENSLKGSVSGTAASLDSTISNLAAALAADEIPAAIALTSATDGSSLLDRYLAFRESVTDRIASQQGTQPVDAAEALALEQLVDSEITLRLAFSEVVAELEAHYLAVLLTDYAGPEDLKYIAERDHLLALLGALQTAVDGINALVNPPGKAQPVLKGPAPTPAVLVSDIMLTSDSTAEAFISQTPESFTLSASVRNTGASPASDVTAELIVSALDNNAITLVSGAVQGVGMLAANDSAPGGADEMAVSWSFTYDGDPTVQQRILLVIDLLQAGNPPEDFRPFGNAALLQPDVELYDEDLDGMPSSWEMANGLNPGLDDAGVDADGDGLSNEQELDLGTLPGVGDSDGDTLSDAEELVPGTDGFVTDPTLADTDGDGTRDDLDGSPLDASSINAPDPGEIPGEPSVGLSATTAQLSEDSPTAVIQVINSGSGTLNWTAVSDSEALVVVSPALPAVSARPASLTLSAAPTFDFSRPGTVTTRVRVLDLSGNVRDVQEILVNVGTVLAAEVFKDGFEERPQ